MGPHLRARRYAPEDGYWIIDVEHGHAEWTFRETPCRQLLTLDYDWRDRLVARVPGEANATTPSGVEVRLRYEVPEDARQQAAAAAAELRDHLLAAGAAADELRRGARRRLLDH